MAGNVKKITTYLFCATMTDVLYKKGFKNNETKTILFMGSIVEP